MGRSKDRGIGEAKNAVYSIKDQVKEEDKSKNNKGNLCNPQCFMNTLIKATKLTRREDGGGFLADSISLWLSQVPMGWTAHLNQPVHWISRRNNGRGFTEEREKKQWSKKKMKKNTGESESL